MVSESVSHGGALPYNWMIENTIAPVTNADGSLGLLQVPWRVAGTHSSAMVADSSVAVCDMRHATGRRGVFMAGLIGNWGLHPSQNQNEVGSGPCCIDCICTPVLIVSAKLLSL